MTISGRIAKLLAANPQCHMFGSRYHECRVGPPADPAVLARVEALAGVELPADYREFVTTIGDGGLGPYYGIMSLTDAMGQVERTSGLASLGKDSPLTEDISIGDLMNRPADWAEHTTRIETDPDYAAGWSQLRAKFMAEPWCHGRLPIAQFGCGDWFFLVLRGPRRGTMWVDSLDSSSGLFCLEVDFRTWYSRWLDDAIDQATNLAYIRTPGGFLRYGNNPR
jgi:hypothetical protein